MNPETSVKIGNRTIDFHIFTGKVMDQAQWATTEQFGGQTTGYVQQGAGFVTSSPVRTVTTTFNQFFLRNADGHELAVKVKNFELALRVGNRATAIWAVVRGHEHHSPHHNYVAIHNHDTKILMTDKFKLKELAIPHYIRFLFVVIAIIIIGAGAFLLSYDATKVALHNGLIIDRSAAVFTFSCIGIVSWVFAGWLLRGFGRARFKKVAEAFNVVAGRVMGS